MTLLTELQQQLQLLQEREAQSSLPPLDQAPSTAPASSKPRLGPEPKPEPEAPLARPTARPMAMDPLSAGMQAAGKLLRSQGVKKRDYPYVYGAGSAGLISLVGKGAGIAGRELQKMSKNESPLAYAADKAFKAIKPILPVASDIGRKGVRVVRDIKNSTQVEDDTGDVKYKLIHSLGETLEDTEKPTMALGERTKAFYDDLLSENAQKLKNMPWYKAQGLGAKFLSASLQATESAPQTAITAVAGAPVMGTLKVTGAVKGLTAGLQRLGVGKKWAGRTANWLSEGLAYSTPEGVLAGLANAEEVGKTITTKPHEELLASPKYVEYFEATPKDMPQMEREGQAKRLLIEDAEVFALGTTCAASMVTGMVAGGGIFGSAGASSSFLMRRVMGFAKEGFQEFVQSGPGEKLPANIAIKMFADPEQDVWKGVWAAAAAGAGPGALMGGFVGSGQKDIDFDEVLTKLQTEKNKLRDTSLRTLKSNNVSDEDLTQMMKSPEALTGYGLQPSDLEGLITNRTRMKQELDEFNDLLVSAPNDAVRQGMKSSFQGQMMQKLQEQIQPEVPRDRKEEKPKTGQTPEAPKEAGPTIREESEIRKELTQAKQEVLDLQSKTPGPYSVKTVREDHVARLAEAQKRVAELQKQIPEIKKPVKEERRKDTKRRKTVEDMTPEEMKKELLTSDLTGLLNKRALKETITQADEKGTPKSVIFIDADSLKTINDLGGHATGDALLKAIGDSVKEVDPDLGFHISGDEFVLLANTPQEAEIKAKKLEKILNSKEIIFTLENGDEYTYSGLGVSYGIAETVAEADRKMGLHKIKREEAGTRVKRGEQPPGLRKTITGKGTVGEGEKQKGVLEKGQEDITAPLVREVTIPELTQEVFAGFQKALGPKTQLTLENFSTNPAIQDRLKAYMDIAEEYGSVGLEHPEQFAKALAEDYSKALVLKDTRTKKKAEKAKAEKAKAEKAKAEKAKAEKAKEEKAKEEKAKAKKAKAEKAKEATKEKALQAKLKEKEMKTPIGRLKYAEEHLRYAANKVNKIKAQAIKETFLEAAQQVPLHQREFASLQLESRIIVSKILSHKIPKQKEPFRARLLDIETELSNRGELQEALTGKDIEFINALTYASSAKDALQWIAKNSNDLSYKAIAKRILFDFPKVDLVIISPSSINNPDIPHQMQRALGLHELTPTSQRIILRNTAFGEGHHGMTETVFLHEAVHAVTVAKINRGKLQISHGTELQKSVIRLLNLQRAVLNALRKRISVTADIDDLRILKRYAERITNPKELITYGMTEPEFQEVLNSIEYKGDTAWNKFVALIAKILGVKNNTAFKELISVTEEILNVELSGKTVSATLDAHGGTIEAALDNEITEKLTPKQKELFDKAFGSQVKQTTKTHVEHIQEEEAKILKAAKTSRSPVTRSLVNRFTRLNSRSTQFKRTEKTQTTSWLDRIFGLPEYSFVRDDAANRVLQIALEMDEVKYNIQTSIAGDFAKICESIRETNPEAYKLANDYMLDVDKSGIGFRLQQVKGKWDVLDLAEEHVATGLTETQAVTRMIQLEQEFLRQQGYDGPACQVIQEFRALTNRAFDAQVKDLRQQIANAKRYGLKEPRIGGKNTPKISTAIATIGDLRGVYFPRERPNKTYVLRATKKGADNVLLTFDAFFPENTESWDITNQVKQVINRQMSVSTEARKLEAQGYKVEGPVLSPMPSEAVFDAPSLAASMDAFLNLAETSSSDDDSKVMHKLHNLLTKKIAELYKAKGSLSSRLSRVQEYTTGFETDAIKAAMAHSQRVASGVVKRKVAGDMILAFTGRDVSFAEFKEQFPEAKYSEYRAFVAERRINPTDQAKLYEDVKRYIHYNLTPNDSKDRALGYLKAGAVLMYLGGRVASAAVNLTNMVMAVPATIAAHAKVSVPVAFKEVGIAAAKYTAYRSRQLIGQGIPEGILSKVAKQAETLAKTAGKKVTKEVVLSKEDIAAFDYITARGWDQAHFNIEALKALQGYSGNLFNNVMSASMYMFGAAEKANRAATIFAAYKTLERQNPDQTLVERMEEAHFISDRSHGIYGKAAKPLLVQSFKGLDLIYTFLKFQHNYMLNMIDVGIKQKNLPAALHMLLIPAVLSGVGASLATPAVAALVKIFGFSDDPEEAVHAWAENHLPNIMQKMLRHGSFGLMNINFKGSLQMTNPFPTKLSEIVGAPGAVVFDMWEAAKHFRYREYKKGLEKLLPTAIETPIKGYRFYTEGVTTKTYSPVFHGKEQLKADELDLFLMILSFNTAELSGIREKQWKETQVKATFSKDRQDILRRLKHIKLSSDPDNIKKLAKIQEAIDRFNLRVERSPSRYRINSLTWSQLNSHLKQAFKPSKFEAQRNEHID